jgi:hypothetical protein
MWQQTKQLRDAVNVRLLLLLLLLMMMMTMMDKRANSFLVRHLNQLEHV